MRSKRETHQVSLHAMLYRHYAIGAWEVSALKHPHHNLLAALLASEDPSYDPELIVESPVVLDLDVPDLSVSSDWESLSTLLEQLALSHMGSESASTLESMLVHYQERFDHAQLQRLKEALKVRPFTKKAVFSVWHPDDIDRSNGSACLVYLWFRRKNKVLICHAHMRACDIYRKFLADLILFSFLHQSIANDLGLARGNMFLCIDSAHIYLRDRPALNRYVPESCSPDV